MSQLGPEPLKESDDWVRGTSLDRLARRIASTDPDGESRLWDQLYLGSAAMNLMRGVATMPEIHRVMANVIAQCEMDVQEGSRRLLELTDMSSLEAKELHFNTRVSAAIINRINQLVRAGQQAALNIENNEQGE